MLFVLANFDVLHFSYFVAVKPFYYLLFLREIFFRIAKMNAQMTTVETVTVVRPLKVISMVCLIASLLLLLLGVFTTYWLKTFTYHTGLLVECVEDVIGVAQNPVPHAPMPGSCQPRQHHSFYTTLVFILMMIGILATLFSITANAMGLKSDDLHRKFMFYKSATYVTLIAVILEIISLVGFPVVFMYIIDEFGVRYWEFDWSYGVAFGAMLFALGALLLLICDKEHEEVYHKEKTIYNPPPYFA